MKSSGWSTMKFARTIRSRPASCQSPTPWLRGPWRCLGKKTAGRGAAAARGGSAAGGRRRGAGPGAGALAYIGELEAQLQKIADLVRGNRAEAAGKVEQLQGRIKRLEKELEQLRAKLATGGSKDLVAEAKEVKGIKVLAAQLDGMDAKGLREALDKLKDKLAPAAIVLASVIDDKVTLIAGVTKELAGRLHAGELVNQVASGV